MRIAYAILMAGCWLSWLPQDAAAEPSLAMQEARIVATLSGLGDRCGVDGRQARGRLDGWGQDILALATSRADAKAALDTIQRIADEAMAAGPAAYGLTCADVRAIFNGRPQQHYSSD